MRRQSRSAANPPIKWHADCAADGSGDSSTVTCIVADCRPPRSSLCVRGVCSGARRTVASCVRCVRCPPPAEGGRRGAGRGADAR